MNGLAGITIIESVFVTEPKDIWVRRTWRERLFSRPWQPRVGTRMETRQVPSSKGYMLDRHTLACHPDFAAELKASLGSGGCL